MLSTDGRGVYATTTTAYTSLVRSFRIGDVIRQARKDKRWDQARLGREAAKFQITGDEQAVNKATISKLEGENPYTSELGVVWRVLAALDLTFADIEQRVGRPFLEHHAAPPKTSTGRRHA